MSLTAPAVEGHFLPMATATENTALMLVISQLVSKEVLAMTDEQFERETLYQATMNLFQALLKKELISEEQYAVIDTKMLAKYKPLLGTLFAENDLI